MEFLAKLFGNTEDGNPEALTYEQLKAKIEADKKLKIVNLEDGGYVSVEKFKSKETEANGYKQQLENANTEIESYKKMDIDGIKQAADSWKQKYETETAALTKQLADQKIEFAEDRFLSSYKFVDDFAKAGVKAEFRAKQFKFDEKTGTFVGADGYMKELMESHKAAFVIDEPNTGNDGGGDLGDGAGAGDAGNAAGGKKPTFLGNPGNQGAGAGEKANAFGFNFVGVRPIPNAGK